VGVRILRASDHLPDRFNAASWFVGRHVAEGRGDRVAIVTDALRPGIDPADLDEELKAFAKGRLRIYKYPQLRRFRLRALLDSRSGP